MPKIIFAILLFIPILSHAWPIPDTGQTKCYDDKTEIPCPKPGEPFYGQDGNYNINPRSFTKLGQNGKELPDDASNYLMVRDNVTGLIWEVKQEADETPNYKNPNDADNVYAWYDPNAENKGHKNKGNNTHAFIQQMNQNKFGGLKNWRLPSFNELASLCNYNKEWLTLYPIFKGPLSAFYWSSTSDARYTGRAWGVHFNHGYDRYRAKDSSYYVRAVRGGQAGSFDYLVINGDSTVTDMRTGLMWSVKTNERLNWKNALKYCEELEVSGLTDWRLPTKEELSSIVDYTKYYPAIDRKYFNNLSAFYWSSTSYAYRTGRAWGVHFDDGHDRYYAKDSSYFVRAVRGGQARSFGNLVIGSPMQAAVLSIGSTLPIQWQTENIRGNVIVSISREGGKAGTFKALATTQNDGLYEWQITGPPSPNCFLKIVPLASPEKGTQQGLFSIQENSIVSERLVPTENIEPSESITQFNPPIIKIFDPKNESITTQSQIPVHISIESVSPIKNLELFVNDEPVVLKKAPQKIKPLPGIDIRDYYVFLPEKQNAIRVVATNTDELTAYDKIWVTRKKEKTITPKGVLYLIAIGVNHLENIKGYNLDYAAKDARDMVELMKKMQGILYEKVNAFAFIDNSENLPYRNAIVDCLNNSISNATVNDTVMIFMAGHGITDNGYFFLTRDAVQFHNNNYNMDTVLQWETITTALKPLKSRKIMILDTCYTAGVNTDSLLGKGTVNEIIVLTSTKGFQKAAECKKFANGCFTYAIRDALGEKLTADTTGDGCVDIAELVTAVRKKLKKITRLEQMPDYNMPQGGSDFIFYASDQSNR